MKHIIISFKDSLHECRALFEKITLVQLTNLCIFELVGWQPKTFPGNAELITCSNDNGARYSESALSLDACKSLAESLGYRYIYFQGLDCRPQGIWCHIYISCEFTRTPNTCGTTYEFIGKA